MGVTKPYTCIRFGAIDVTKPYEIYTVWGEWVSPKPIEFKRFGANVCHQTLKRYRMWGNVYHQTLYIYKVWGQWVSPNRVNL